MEDMSPAGLHENNRLTAFLPIAVPLLQAVITPIANPKLLLPCCSALFTEGVCHTHAVSTAGPVHRMGFYLFRIDKFRHDSP